jgi:hypothetical protein
MLIDIEKLDDLFKAFKLDHLDVKSPKLLCHFYKAVVQDKESLLSDKEIRILMKAWKILYSFAEEEDDDESKEDFFEKYKIQILKYQSIYGHLKYTKPVKIT